jgi:RNA polymerase sigma factor (sigma-70 family)
MKEIDENEEQSAQPDASRSAVSRAYVENRNFLHKYLSRFLSDRHDVEDVAQEAFLRAFVAEQQKEIEQPKAYLFRTAKNVALTRLTKKSHQITDYIEECSASVVIDNVERPDKELEAEQKFGLYCEALASLSDKCREVFLLRKVHGLPHKEIAERMGLTVSSVEKYLRTGILECQDLVRLNEEQRSGSAQKLRKSSVEIEKQR